MRKQEYIHVHGLLVEISHYLIDRGDMSAEMLAEYRDLDTGSVNVHESKGNHHDAIRVLATATKRRSNQQPMTFPPWPVR